MYRQWQAKIIILWKFPLPQQFFKSLVQWRPSDNQAYITPSYWMHPVSGLRLKAFLVNLIDLMSGTSSLDRSSSALEFISVNAKRSNMFHYKWVNLRQQNWTIAFGQYNGNWISKFKCRISTEPLQILTSFKFFPNRPLFTRFECWP